MKATKTARNLYSVVKVDGTLVDLGRIAAHVRVLHLDRGDHVGEDQHGEVAMPAHPIAGRVAMRYGWGVSRSKIAPVGTVMTAPTCRRRHAGALRALGLRGLADAQVPFEVNRKEVLLQPPSFQGRDCCCAHARMRW